MKDIKVISAQEDYKYMDCCRIVKVMNDNGYNCSIEQAKKLWEDYSDSFAAGWLCFPDNDEWIFENIRPYFEEINDE